MGLLCLFYCYKSSWWMWDGGSLPFFWRWPKEWVKDIRDGIPPWFVTTPDTEFKPQRKNTDKVAREKEANKIRKVLRQGYIEMVANDQVKGLMHYFSVPKGQTDIRMVYDGTRSGLNQAVWVPWFPLPTIGSLERTCMCGYYQVDNDYGDFFLNFVFHRFYDCISRFYLSGNDSLLTLYYQFSIFSISIV